MEIKSFFYKNWKWIAAFFFALIGIVSLIWLPADNAVEQIAEKQIENLTGIKLDLSPEGPIAPPPLPSPKGMNGAAEPK